MFPVSFEQDALAIEPSDDFQRLLVTFAWKPVQQGAPFDLVLEAVQKSRQPLVKSRRTKGVSEIFARDQTDGVPLGQNRKGKRESNPVWKNLCVHQRRS